MSTRPPLPPLTVTSMHSKYTNSKSHGYWLVVAVLSLVFVSLYNPQSLAGETVQYDDALPILNQFCIGCHTKDDPEGGYVMESYTDLMRGGEHGVAITPGSSNSSRLLLMLQGKLQPTMPPDGEPRPTERQIEILVNWVEQGAIGPDGPPEQKRMLKTPTVKANPKISLPTTAFASNQRQKLVALATYGQIVINYPTQEQRIIKDELYKINSLEFSADGTRLLVASGRTGAYGTASVYSTESGARLLELNGHRDTLYAAIYSPDNKIIATAGYDKEIVIWDAQTGEPLQNFNGHNGAIFDLAFSSDGKTLFSASADETIKVWDVTTGTRLETLGQPEGEVISIALSKDNRFILAGGTDHRVRVWKRAATASNNKTELIATRFVDDSTVNHIEFTPNNQAVVVVTEAGNIKLIDPNSWNLVTKLEPLPDTATALQLPADQDKLIAFLMNGDSTTRIIPYGSDQAVETSGGTEPVYLDIGAITSLNETELPTKEHANKNRQGLAMRYRLIPRNAEVAGSIGVNAEADLFRWTANKGEQWAIDVDAAKDSKIDPIVTVLDADMNPVLQTRLQATRESYFTFRGKDSMQVGDFRLFNWEEMHLNDYLYSAGEVTKLWLYPRGPDSGYNVYPNEGQRWTYFGTTHTTHALGEPAYVVRPLPDGAEPAANGLPTFDIYYENDDDPTRREGKNSRILFNAPASSNYFIRVKDTRGKGGEAFRYIARVRPAAPDYIPSVTKANGNLHRGTGREFKVQIDRIDGFNGEVTFDIPDLPESIVSNLPVTIEEGQRFATGCLWIPEDVTAWDGKVSPTVIATATILGKRVERNLGPVGDLIVADRPKVIPTIQRIDGNALSTDPWTLKVRRGETISARVTIDRISDFTAEVSFGKEDSGRNAPHGVYVDNIGLSGLLVRQNESVREFFITADPITKPGKRWFHLRAGADGGITSRPVMLEVLP